MIEIKKGAEPDELRKLRNKAIGRRLSPKEAYKTLCNPLKQQVRDSLVHEQGQLCAYCMCKIPRDDAEPEIAPIVIEHFIPRNPEDNRDVGQGLDYNNFLAVCHGNRGRKGTRNIIDLTCDAHRRNTDFKKINPCQKETLSSITYTLDGKIDASDSRVKYDLIDTLNLNCPTSPLLGERKAALDSLIDEIGQLGDVEERELLEFCRKSLHAFEAETDIKTPYAGILIWYLQTMVASMAG